MELPSPNTCTCGLWVLIPSSPEGEVASELKTLRVGCLYVPLLYHGKGRKELNKQGQGPSPFFFSKKSHGLMTHQPLHT